MAKQIAQLTVMRIKHAKPEDYPLRDGKGLMLVRSVTGKTLWRHKYRRADGKESMRSLGEYPEVSLERARIAANEGRALLLDGKDPVAVKAETKAAKRRASDAGFSVVAEAWLAMKQEAWADETYRKARLVIDDYLTPSLRKVSIETLTSRQAADVLTTMNAKVPALARKARQYLDGIVQYAIREDLREDGRLLVLKGVLTKKEKGNIPAATDVSEVTALVNAIAAHQSPVTRCALTFAMLTAMRPGVVVRAEWSEMNPKTMEWHVPGSKMKTRHAHISPLPKQALAVLDEMRGYSGGQSFVFPPLARQKSPHLSRDSLSKALRGMGFADRHATHGFRAMLRTLGRERLEIDADVLEAQLAHAKKGEVAQAYDRTKHLTKRHTAMQQWADYLDTLRSEA